MGRSLVVRSHPENFDYALLSQHLIDQPVLDGDATRKGSGEISGELLEGRRSSQRIRGEQLEERFRLRPETGGDELASVLLSLFRKHDAPGTARRYQPGFSEHFEIGVRIPRRIESLMRGIASR